MHSRMHHNSDMSCSCQPACIYRLEGASLMRDDCRWTARKSSSLMQRAAVTTRGLYLSPLIQTGSLTQGKPWRLVVILIKFLKRIHCRVAFLPSSIYKKRTKGSEKWQGGVKVTVRPENPDISMLLGVDVCVFSCTWNTLRTKVVIV